MRFFTKQLKAINNGTSGTITLLDASGDLSGDASDLKLAFDGITSYEGNVTVVDQPNVDELKTINLNYTTYYNNTVTSFILAFFPTIFLTPCFHDRCESFGFIAFEENMNPV